MRGNLGSDDTAHAAARVDNHIAVNCLAELRSNQASDKVGGAARGGRHEQAYRFLGQILCAGDSLRQYRNVDYREFCKTSMHDRLLKATHLHRLRYARARYPVINLVEA